MRFYTAYIPPRLSFLGRMMVDRSVMSGCCVELVVHSPGIVSASIASSLCSRVLIRVRSRIFVGHVSSRVTLSKLAPYCPSSSGVLLLDVDLCVTPIPTSSPHCMFVSPSATEHVNSIIMCKARSLISEASGKKEPDHPVKVRVRK
jgi:hypothetical protein